MPTERVTFHVRLSAMSTAVFLFTPGPSRWKLWNELWSEMTNLRRPGLACVTLALLAFLERDRRRGCDRAVERPGGGNGRNCERTGQHEAEDEGAACHSKRLTSRRMDPIVGARD